MKKKSTLKSTSLCRKKGEPIKAPLKNQLTTK